MVQRGKERIPKKTNWPPETGRPRPKAIKSISRKKVCAMQSQSAGFQVCPFPPFIMRSMSSDAVECGNSQPLSSTCNMFLSLVFLVSLHVSISSVSSVWSSLGGRMSGLARLIASGCLEPRRAAAYRSSFQFPLLVSSRNLPSSGHRPRSSVTLLAQVFFQTRDLEVTLGSSPTTPRPTPHTFMHVIHPPNRPSPADVKRSGHHHNRQIPNVRPRQVRKRGELFHSAS